LRGSPLDVGEAVEAVDPVGESYFVSKTYVNIGDLPGAIYVSMIVQWVIALLQRNMRNFC
jgi:hypothetical protein